MQIRPSHRRVSERAEGAGLDGHHRADRVSELKASLDKYLTGAEKPTAEALAEVTKAVHELADISWTFINASRESRSRFPSGLPTVGCHRREVTARYWMKKASTGVPVVVSW